ncbi:MAG TPA: BadF/BadG/BcrA/BcrD ATPase family protein [Candidatus Acidoferrales bacterium]|nr:BadF/BadG/BcrA/BcrD ATPase family protein [Candidatus Acidoferrales bacterium]
MSKLQKYFLGVDGGATKTTAAIINSGKEVLDEKAGGPSNFQIIGIPQTSRNILDITLVMLDSANLKFAEIAGIFLGLTGAGEKREQDRMKKGFEEFVLSMHLPVPWIGVESDALAALEGAFPGKEGMVLISGTGSILLAKDAAGTVYRVGGWGRFVGDEGSGYAIGRAGLKAYAEQHDGRGKKTKISDFVEKELNIDSPQSLVLKIYHENFDIASTARFVLAAAEKGDEVALSILDDAAKDLFLHVSAAISKIGKEVSIAFMGGILTHENMLVAKLTYLIRQRYPAMKIILPERSAAVGAALLAMKGVEAHK